MRDGSEEAGIIIAVVEAGAGITEATALVNEHRAPRAAGPDADPISWNAVRSWIAANPAITIDRRAKKKKSGSGDMGSGLVCDSAGGGVFPPKMPITPVKYLGKARVRAGACM